MKILGIMIKYLLIAEIAEFNILILRKYLPSMIVNEMISMDFFEPYRDEY
jgi:hypothetical protein